MPDAPAAPASPATTLARLFRAVSRLRGRRSLHPVGTGYEGWLEIVGDRRWRNVPLFELTATRPALVRCSRAVGLPEPLPDILGIAIKLPNAYGPGGDQDLLFSSVPDRPAVRGVLVPRRSFLLGAFSTLLPYRVGHKRIVLWLRPVTARQEDGRGRAFAELSCALDRTVSYELWAGGALRRPQRIGRLSLTERLPADHTDALRFNPWVTGPGIRPTGWINRLRRPSYEASQLGWSPRR